MILNERNYHSLEANREYWSVSQFKAFQKCQDAAMNELTGEFIRPTTDALLMGSYVDAYFSGSGEEFQMNHPEIFNSRTGKLKAQYQKADRAIERVERDKLFMKFLSGRKQVILTGHLFDERWKAKIDFLHTDMIVDLKFMKDMKAVYDENDGTRKPFIDYYGYDIQGFVYQQLVKKAAGEEIPFYLAVITKEEIPDYDIIQIPQWKLNSAGEYVKHYLKEYVSVKRGEIHATRCGSCQWCRETKVLQKARSYEDLLEE